MQNLSIGDIFLALGDLLREEASNHRRKSLLSTQCGAYYLDKLSRRRDEIGALPERYRGGRPKADELGEADLFHDGYGGGWQQALKAYLRLPDLSKEHRATIEDILATFATDGLSELKLGYADEAKLATERQQKLSAYKEALTQFPVLGGTLYDWVSKQITYGVSLDKLVSEQTKEEAAIGSRVQASTLRSNTIGLLYRFRKELLEEIQEKKLAATLESDIFGYLDELHRKRVEALPEKPKASEPAKPA